MRRFDLGVVIRKAEVFFLLTVTSFYTVVVSGLFSAFNCQRQPDGSYTLISNNSIVCYQGEWQKTHFGALVFFTILYFVVFPLYLMLVFYRIALDLQEIPEGSRLTIFGSAKHLHFIRRSYKKKFFWWSAVDLLKRISIIACGTFLSGVDDTKTVNYLATLILLIVFLLIDVVVMQYSRIAFLRVSLLWNAIALIVLLSDALMFKGNSVSDSTKNAVSVILIVCVCFCVLIVVLSKMSYFQRNISTINLENDASLAVVNETAGALTVPLDAETCRQIKTMSYSSEGIQINNLRLMGNRSSHDLQSNVQVITIEAEATTTTANVQIQPAQFTTKY
jgi:hypothetical protein